MKPSLASYGIYDIDFTPDLSLSFEEAAVRRVSANALPNAAILSVPLYQMKPLRLASVGWLWFSISIFL